MKKLLLALFLETSVAVVFVFLPNPRPAFAQLASVNVSNVFSASTYTVGQAPTVTITVTDPDGLPVVGAQIFSFIFLDVLVGSDQTYATDSGVTGAGGVWSTTAPAFTQAASYYSSVQVSSTAASPTFPTNNQTSSNVVVSAAACTENWTCGGWSTCSSGTQARTCTDSNSCGTTTSRPAISQPCSAPAAPTVPSATKTSSGAAAAGSTTEVGLPNPIRCPDATCLVSQVIRYILGTIAVIATLMFIWGGVMMLTSGGNPEMVKKAKETLTWATIGIVVILISWAAIRFVLAGISGTSAG